MNANAIVDAGEQLASLFSPQGGSGHSVGLGTVRSVSGVTATVAISGATLPGLPMTTACAAAKAGDRCIVETIGPQAIVTGLIAK